MDDTPRPRILFESVSDELFESLTRYAPTIGRLGHDVPAIHPTDWDLIVSCDSEPEGPSGVNVLSFGGQRFENAKTGTGITAIRQHESHARVVQRDEGCPAEFASLVDRTIVSPAPAPPRDVFGRQPREWFQAIATIGAERAPYAGIMSTYGSALILALPDYVTSHGEWLSAFIDYLRGLQPTRFPAPPDWQRREAWATPDMRVSLGELGAIALERVAALERLATQEVAAKTALDQAAVTAAAGPQRVLTSDGADLVAAVLALLRDLGFTVEDRDDHHDQKTGAKLEDLLVTDGGWACLAEVKGYTKGAKVTDVSQIAGRPSVAYAAEHRRAPDVVWHIVNGWRTKDPSTREKAIPNELDLKPLTSADGCLIDTRDLFRAWRDVQEGRATAEGVREAMRKAITRWSWASDLTTPPTPS
ncbi:hypothetical protein [Promicromonospora iranensis]|uniref:Restriction endonuclease n=1 Tax=Promicromonospora iranensis TaxID=1105144 RepID=A0ABU2CIF6_9MICO|nr:hypothetical protein [Promicromonospora iranensis]MDR7381109.1 hypothetical protein [Promicromonospora iranensis]